MMPDNIKYTNDTILYTFEVDSKIILLYQLIHKIWDIESTYLYFKYLI